MAGLPFCPKCGFDTGEAAESTARLDAPMPGPASVDAGRDIDLDPFPSSAASAGAAEPGPSHPVPARGRRSMPLIMGALVVAAALVAFGWLMRPSAETNPGVVPQGGSAVPGITAGPGASPPGPTAPIVGITIQSPQDGQSVATGEVTVIGLAPPGLTITRDISFGLDQHAASDATGHWAINVKLDQGVNTLVFRIGDDRSTETRLRVTFAPPAAT